MDEDGDGLLDSDEHGRSHDVIHDSFTADGAYHLGLPNIGKILRDIQ